MKLKSLNYCRQQSTPSPTTASRYFWDAVNQIFLNLRAAVSDKRGEWDVLEGLKEMGVSSSYCPAGFANPGGAFLAVIQNILTLNQQSGVSGSRLMSHRDLWRCLSPASNSHWSKESLEAREGPVIGGLDRVRVRIGAPGELGRLLGPAKNPVYMSAPKIRNFLVS